ncbi:hypothetical protein PIB30_038841 [Stylosanthes scabra]|uniref:ENTH domain-containing protein n=1 Tax=Stylosanthes scabra TaxID=79078 RepID=A0ABU6UDV0_9FABA|nr:hypothetical protein [Stylosanthes scabra]
MGKGVWSQERTAKGGNIVVVRIRNIAAATTTVTNRTTTTTTQQKQQYRKEEEERRRSGKIARRRKGVEAMDLNDESGCGGIAKIASNMAPNLELAVVKATNHDVNPAGKKYIREI